MVEPNTCFWIEMRKIALFLCFSAELAIIAEQPVIHFFEFLHFQGNAFAWCSALFILMLGNYFWSWLPWAHGQVSALTFLEWSTILFLMTFCFEVRFNRQIPKSSKVRLFWNLGFWNGNMCSANGVDILNLQSVRARAWRTVVPVWKEWCWIICCYACTSKTNQFSSFKLMKDSSLDSWAIHGWLVIQLPGTSATDSLMPHIVRGISSRRGRFNVV